MRPPPSDPNPTARALRRRRILDALGAVSRQLEGLLAGQNLTLQGVELPQERDPSASPLERLQAFKGLLNACLRELDEGRQRCCVRCARPLPSDDLDALPWADRCRDASTCDPGQPR